MTALELKDITFTYEEGAEVLHHVNFHADHGEVTLLSGYSGTGKSTVLHILSGIIPDTIRGTLTGDVLVDEEKYNGKRIGEFCRKIGLVLQNADEQIIQTSVEDEIAFGCENLNFEPKFISEQIDKTCKLMELKKEWKPRKLSGGQKQRLLTACILAMDQHILIMDEPLANLDKEGAELVMNLARKLAHEEDYAVLVVEHRLDVVLPYVDVQWTIDKGVITKVDGKDNSQTRIIPDTCPPYQDKGDVLFSLNHVAFRADKRDILKDITFDIKKGERIVLLGENGCGKTTLMRCIAKLNKLSGGTIEGPKWRKWFRHVGVVYQNPNYQLFMPTVEREVYFSCKSEERTREILELFKLTDISERHPQSLSEGQKRRVSIAAVAAEDPDILLLDEPTVGQDYEGLTDLVEIINNIHMQSDTTIITVTHDSRCAEALCDHAILIAGGVVAKEGGKELVRSYFSLD